MIDKKGGEEVCHLNKNKTDNRLSNLSIETISESQRISYKRGSMEDWGIGDRSKINRRHYEKDNGAFKNGKLVNLKCSCCGVYKDVGLFYHRNNNHRRECKECSNKASGVKNIGALTYRIELAKKGRRICSVCKVEKDLYIDFGNSKRSFMGKTNSCRMCVKELNAKYRISHN